MPVNGFWYHFGERGGNSWFSSLSYFLWTNANIRFYVCYFLGAGHDLDHLDHFLELEVAHGEAMPNDGVLMRV